MYKGFFVYSWEKCEETLYLQTWSYDIGKAEVFGFGENQSFG